MLITIAEIRGEGLAIENREGIPLISGVGPEEDAGARIRPSQQGFSKFVGLGFVPGEMRAARDKSDELIAVQLGPDGRFDIVVVGVEDGFHIWALLGSQSVNRVDKFHIAVGHGTQPAHPAAPPAFGIVPGLGHRLQALVEGNLVLRVRHIPAQAIAANAAAGSVVFANIDELGLAGRFPVVNDLVPKRGLGNAHGNHIRFVGPLQVQPPRSIRQPGEVFRMGLVVFIVILGKGMAVSHGRVLKESLPSQPGILAL